MSTAWMFYVLAIGLLLVLAATAIGAALRAVRAPQRWTYALALAGMAALAVAAPTRRPAAGHGPVTVVSISRDVTSRPDAERTVVERLRETRARIEGEADAFVTRADAMIPRAAFRVVAGLWMVASLVLLILFVAVNTRLLRARRRWPIARVHDQAVRIAPRTGPAVIGFSRAEIVVPRSLLERSAEEQRLILVHEHEHLRARDHLLLAGAWVITIAFPWHPAAWMLLERLRLAIELDCDARVLRGGAGARSYGALLIDMAAQASGIRMGALALADGPSHLERRIRAMKKMGGRGAAMSGMLAGAVGALLVLAACEAKVPTAADIKAMDVTSAQKQASALGVSEARAENADYLVNGVKVGADEARAIPAARIASVEVVKSENPLGRDTIFVTTVERARLMDKVAGAEQGTGADVPSYATRMRVPMDTAVGIMIDGKKSTRAALAALSPQEIVSVRVEKVSDSGPGEIVVHTKAVQP